MGFHWSRTDPTVGQGFLRIAQEQAEKAIAATEDTARSTDTRVHQARRRSKKLRALLRLVRPDFPQYAAENAAVRDAARALSGARDQWVARETYAELMSWAGRPGPAPERRPADAEAEAAALATFGADMRALHARTADWSVRRIDFDTLATGLKHTYAQARRLRRFAERHRTAEAFHEWRKYTKYHFNQLSLLSESARDVLPSLHQSAGELADSLGKHHDLWGLEQFMAQAPAELGHDIDIAFASEAIARRRAELEARIGVLGRQLFAESPKAVKTRFAAYLAGWSQHEVAR